MERRDELLLSILEHIYNEIGDGAYMDYSSPLCVKIKELRKLIEEESSHAK